MDEEESERIRESVRFSLLARLLEKPASVWLSAKLFLHNLTNSWTFCAIVVIAFDVWLWQKMDSRSHSIVLIGLSWAVLVGLRRGLRGRWGQQSIEPQDARRDRIGRDGLR